jgi:hypothetical protein
VPPSRKRVVPADLQAWNTGTFWAVMLELYCTPIVELLVLSGILLAGNRETVECAWTGILHATAWSETYQDAFLLHAEVIERKEQLSYQLVPRVKMPSGGT